MDKFKKQLIDCGLDDKQIDIYLKSIEYGNKDECIRCLYECRKEILNDIYRKKHQMCNLDCLISNFKEEKDND